MPLLLMGFFILRRCNKIMSDASSIVRDRQSAIRRELDRRGVSLKAVGFDAQVPYSTLLSYFPEEGGREPAMMPVAVLFKLIGVIPNDLLSLLLPDGNIIVSVPEGVDHDEMEAGCLEFLATKHRAHHPDSPGGREIADCERKELNKRAARISLVA